ncbi:hypothetical protein NVP1031O_064 [Vibrio phage 1.031.O._10N.261.46.F8]|nr:hypothetical protein NVP1031O_064 [Vibrio phage 1.031.O._10N.261.46.F8]
MLRASEDEYLVRSLSELEKYPDDEFELWSVKRSKAIISRCSGLINKISNKNAERLKEK